MRRTNRLASLATLILAGAAAPLHATLLTIAQPGAAYTSSTSLLPVTASELANVSSVTDGIFTATFSELLQVATVPTDWLTWGSPPAVENATPRVLISPGTTSTLLTITFSQPVTLFGLEAMPDGFGPEPMTENFYNGASNIGSILLTPDGSAGALLFAASSTIPITSIDITTTANPLENGTDFAVAELRYALAAPEPNTWIALAAGLGIIGWSRRRKLG
jgi:hypothetical protein